ncbi:hypothetical protein AV530_011016 [Patagioenas fasciata monilis]|uniref:Uncharacterized protein n=1 Tax=Patagioenas fasciata monilis TaxID=372326 RepID=A0A1V4L120_PATFA|nr:hypothetical protein AV530_011016 [Patagioenas fasciata monilis]
MLGRKRKLSSEAGGCPPQGGTPQSSVPRAQKREATPGRSNLSRQATSAIDIDALIDGMQRMSIGPPCHAVEPKRVCLLGSSQSSQRPMGLSAFSLSRIVCSGPGCCFLGLAARYGSSL